MHMHIMRCAADPAGAVRQSCAQPDQTAWGVAILPATLFGTTRTPAALFSQHGRCCSTAWHAGTRPGGDGAVGRSRGHAHARLARLGLAASAASAAAAPSSVARPCLLNCFSNSLRCARAALLHALSASGE